MADILAGDHPDGTERFLAADEGSALSAWVGAAIAMVGMLVAAFVIGVGTVLYQRHRSRSAVGEVQKMPAKSPESGGKKPEAWPDPEMGGDHGSMLDKASTVHADAATADKLSPSVRLELAETLRGILEDEISRGLKASGISDRLDRLEMQAREQQVVSGCLLPQAKEARALDAAPALDATVKAQAGSPVSSPDWAVTVKPEAQIRKRDAETLTELSLSDVAALTEAQSTDRCQANLGIPSKLVLSPSGRQKRYPDPPEKGWQHIDEDRSLRMSLQTVQRNLQKRDGQTQELHRQLRLTQQDCQHQKLEAVHAVKRLQDLLSDPSTAPQAQAQELKHLRNSAKDLSGLLADSRQSETHWQLVAKRQRAFFMQSERVAQEGVNVFRKHPAGELFLAPPPVYLEDDVDEDPRKPPWDIGTSHINPYVNDSWPFEPNACAQRCAVEPNLGRWDEEDENYPDSDSEEGSADSGSDPERAQLMLRLPTLPPEAPHDEDFEPPEPTDAPEPLPPLGELAQLSARSL